MTSKNSNEFAKLNARHGPVTVIEISLMLPLLIATSLTVTMHSNPRALSQMPHVSFGAAAPMHRLQLYQPLRDNASFRETCTRRFYRVISQWAVVCVPLGPLCFAL